MSRSAKDHRETESMLTRLAALLYGNPKTTCSIADARADAESLRRISMTLHRWHELECGIDGGCIERGHKSRDKLAPGGFIFNSDENGASYWANHNGDRTTYTKIPDREAGALKRLAAIMARYPALSSYVQTDPRGCALYILRPGDVPANGFAVWCLDDVASNGDRGDMVRCSSKTFPTEEAARAYAVTLAKSRSPEVRPVPGDASAYYSRGLAVHQ